MFQLLTFSLLVIGLSLSLLFKNFYGALASVRSIMGLLGNLPSFFNELLQENYLWVVARCSYILLKKNAFFQIPFMNKSLRELNVFYLFNDSQKISCFGLHLVSFFFVIIKLKSSLAFTFDSNFGFWLWFRLSLQFLPVSLEIYINFAKVFRDCPPVIETRCCNIHNFIVKTCYIHKQYIKILSCFIPLFCVHFLQSRKSKPTLLFKKTLFQSDSYFIINNIYFKLLNKLNHIDFKINLHQRSTFMKSRFKNQNRNGFEHLDRLPCQPSQSLSARTSQNQLNESDHEGSLVLEEFCRQIQERFKWSVANKLYSFPRKLTSADDIISSEEDQSQEDSQDDHQQVEALKPISKVKLQNKIAIEKKEQNTKQKQKIKPFKRKEIYYVKQTDNQKTHEQTSNSKVDPKDTKFAKSKKKEVKKEKSKEKNESFRGWERETNRSKRFNTEPDSHNYHQTLRSKTKK